MPRAYGAASAKSGQSLGAPAFAEATARSRRSAKRVGGSVYARKNDLPARVLRGRLRLGLIRRPVRDRLDNQVVRGAWDESGASADGDACRPFFDLTPRAARIAPRPWPDSAEAARRHGGAVRAGRAPKACRPCGAMRPARCVPAVRLAQAGAVEKRTAGGPIRGRRDSPLRQRHTRRPTLISATRTPNPSDRGDREARAGGALFPRVRPIRLRASRSGETSP